MSQPSGFHTYPLPNGPIMKQHYENPADDPDYEPERQCFGFFIMIVEVIGFSIFTLYAFVNAFIVNKYCGITGIGGTFLLYFLILSLAKPAYLGGKPKISKLWPNFVALVLIILAATLIVPKQLKLETAIGGAVQILIVMAVQNCIFIQDDTKPNCLICLKPWVYKKKNNYPQLQGYPPPQGYQPQGFYQPQPHPQGPQGQSQVRKS